MSEKTIPFNKPWLVGREHEYINQAVAHRHLAGNGPFTRRCQTWLEERTGARRAFLTHSCSGALEMAALLIGVGPGDEVIMPSFTFVSTANAFALRGATPVFVDVRHDTLNLDERLIEAAITPKTRAIVVVHYAGVACEMDAIVEIASRHGLFVVEDAAQGLLASYRGRGLGSIGHLAALSFHETKNVISGQGGALLLNDDRFTSAAEIAWEKGTNRSQFFRGQVDKYTWVGLGSSYLPSEITAAFLWAQLESADTLTSDRMATWRRYHDAFAELETRGLVQRPVVPSDRTHNAHIYYLLLRDLEARTAYQNALRDAGVHAVFHYVPLHSSPAGLQYGRAHGALPETDRASDCSLRLPLWPGLPQEDIERVIDATQSFFAARAKGDGR